MLPVSFLHFPWPDLHLPLFFLLNPARGVAASLMYDCPYRARFKAPFKVSNYSILIVKGKTSVILVLPFPASFLHFLLPNNRMTIV